MKKQALKTGLSLLLIVNILSSATLIASAEDISENTENSQEVVTLESSSDNQSDTSTQETTSVQETTPVQVLSSAPEDQVVHNAPITPSETIAKQNSIDTWKMLHCQILAQGFIWARPTSDYLSKAQCDGKDVGTSSLLLEQRQRVIDFLRQNPAQTTSQSDIFDEKTFRAYGERIQKNIEYEKKDKNAFVWSELMEDNNNFLKNHPNLPNHNKEALVFSLMREKIGIPFSEFKQIAAQRNLAEIQKVLNKYSEVHIDDIAFLSSIHNLDQINITKKSSIKGVDIYSSANIAPLTKEGKNMAVSMYDVELKNAPRWITLSVSENAVRENFTMTVLESQINFSETIPSEFQIVLTNKITRKKFEKNVKIVVRDESSTNNVNEFTLSQFTLAIIQYLTSK